MLNRVCTICNAEKDIHEFGTDSQCKAGRRSQCRDCINAAQRARYTPEKARTYKRTQYKRDPLCKRKWNLKSTYGLTIEAYAQMLTQQNNRCAICQSKDAGVRNAIKANNFFHVDHCHETGKVRGLLCSNCNLGIGNLKHNEALLQAALRYLKT